MKVEKYKISVVSYTNTLPFKVAIEQDSEIKAHAILTYDNPAICAKKLISNQSDIGLIPVGVLPILKNYQIVSNYCIGANGAVETVMLYSNAPLNKLHTVYLDPQSRTSVNLVQVLANKFWEINPEFKNGGNQIKEQQLGKDEGFVLIGDRTFAYQSQFPYEYDLAEEWKKFTGLPFVFAAWVANKPIDEAFLLLFNQSLKKGVDMIPEISKAYSNSVPSGVDLYNYLSNCISFTLDEEKRQAMNLFLGYMEELDL